MKQNTQGMARGLVSAIMSGSDLRAIARPGKMILGKENVI
jgi:hypothetical protein